MTRITRKNRQSTCRNGYNDSKHKLTPLTMAEPINSIRNNGSTRTERQPSSNGIMAEPETKMLIKNLALGSMNRPKLREQHFWNGNKANGCGRGLRCLKRGR